MLRGPLSILVLRLGAVTLVYTLLRLQFWALNSMAFPDPSFWAFVGGVRFDLSAIAWLHLPWIVLFLINPYPNKQFGRIQFWVFMAINAITLFFQCVDLEFYKFSLKRSTADFLNMMISGGDTINLVPAFLRDYWYIALIYVACLALLGWIYKRVGHIGEPVERKAFQQIGWRILAVVLVALASRGGLQLMPLQVLDGAKYGGASYLPLVLNTPFTMMTSLGKPTLEERVYMDQAEADALWPVVHQYNALPNVPFDSVSNAQRPNVVVIILESFSAVYSGRLGGGEGYMPFLDSLMGQSLNMTNAYANGRRSVDGIPAVLASMPEWMDEAFLTSPYASLPFTSIASVLGKEGYSTSFYHGGRNGTMGFDGFVRSAGFDRYVGLNEYTGPATDHDGHWGIRDLPYLQYYVAELSKEKEPFISSVFTLSSHHPYELLPEDAERFKGGTLAIHPTLRYTDNAVRQFFLSAAKMPWFANTLFVITADHTADIERTGSHSDKAIDHWVPLFYYMPNKIAPAAQPRITQHIDILPTTLDLIGCSDRFFSFGHSALRNETRPYAIMASNGVYSVVSEHAQVKFDGDQVIETRTLDSSSTVDPILAAEMELYLKAAIQQYNGHLIKSQLTITPEVP
ncbi:MAG: sulfatase-like hydrolase/transferase [Flavobacteriales bacterium]|nr:sulfatase-like hydrolase/transferase [Flavobacteriales bacterium]